MTNPTEQPYTPADDYKILIAQCNRTWEDALHDAFPGLAPPLEPDMVAAWAHAIEQGCISLTQELDDLQTKLDTALDTIYDLQSQIAELGGIDDPNA